MNAIPLPPEPGMADDARPSADASRIPASMGDPTMSGPALSPVRSVARGALTLLMTQPITWAATLLATIVMPRYLGADGLGRLAVAGIVSGFASLGLTLGIPEYLGRRVATHPHLAQREGGSALLLTIATTSLGALALWWVAPLFPLPVSATLIRISLIGMVVAAMHGVLYAMLRGQERHGHYAWLNVAIAVGPTLTGVLVLMLGGDINQFASSTPLAGLVIFLVFWHMAGYRIERGAFHPRLALQLARAGLPFLGWRGALNARGSVEGAILATLANTATVGWYGVAWRIVSVPVFIPTLVTTPLLPALSRCADDRSTFLHTVRWNVVGMLLLMAPICAGIFACADAIPDLMHWPEEFDQAAAPMAILSLTMPLIAVDMVLGTAVLAQRRERVWMVVAVAAAIVSPVLMLLLVPLFERIAGNGAMGAAWVVVGTELVMLGGAVALLPRGTLDAPTLWRIARIVGAGVGLVVVTRLLLPVWLPAAVAGGSLTYAALVLLLRAMTVQEMRTFAMIILGPLRQRMARDRRGPQGGGGTIRAAGHEPRPAGEEGPAHGRTAAAATSSLAPEP